MTVYYEVEKSRNELRFIREDNKYCFIDLNDGSIHGFSGKVVKNYPTGVKTKIEDEMYCDTMSGLICRLIYKDCSADFMGMVERIAAATNNYSYYSSFKSREREAAETMQRENISESKLIKALRERKQEWDNEDHSYYAKFSWSISELVKSISESALFGENGRYANLVEQYGLDKVKCVYDKYSCYTKMIKKNPNWVYRFLKYQEDALFNKLVATNVITEVGFYSVLDNIAKYCDEMEVKLPKGNSLLDEYELLKNNHFAWKNAAKEEAFKEVQSKITPYENDEFIALIPTTIQEVVKEGNEQRNCAGGYWLDHYGNSDTKFARGMIFVRKKSNPDKAYITCDFTVADGEIWQYYYACNKSVYDDAENRFRKELQQHLYRCICND